MIENKNKIFFWWGRSTEDWRRNFPYYHHPWKLGEMADIMGIPLEVYLLIPATLFKSLKVLLMGDEDGDNVHGGAINDVDMLTMLIQRR